MDRLREPIPTTPQNITDPTKEHHILKKVSLAGKGGFESRDRAVGGDRRASAASQ